MRKDYPVTHTHTENSSHIHTLESSSVLWDSTLWEETEALVEKSCVERNSVHRTRQCGVACMVMYAWCLQLLGDCPCLRSQVRVNHWQTFAIRVWHKHWATVLWDWVISVLPHTTCLSQKLILDIHQPRSLLPSVPHLMAIPYVLYCCLGLSVSICLVCVSLYVVNRFSIVVSYPVPSFFQFLIH